MESLNTKELVRKELADKQFGEKEIELISGAIDEFDDLFGKYVSKEELMRRLKEYLKEIKFKPVLQNGKVIGLFHEDKKEISILESLSEQEMKSVFFHEFIHCITYDPKKGTCGFREKYEIYDSDKITYIGNGLNEGFTQFVTGIRNEKYGDEQKINSYPILSEQVENLVGLIGKDKFLDIGFNRPQQLQDEMDSIDEFAYYNLLESFDVIWKEENDIYMKTRKPFSKQEKLTNILLGMGSDTDRLKEAKQGIINIFQEIILKKPIKTIDEFNAIYDKICQYCNQLNCSLGIKILRLLQPKIIELQNAGMSIDDILTGINTEYADFFNADEFVNKFKSLSNEDKLRLLADKDFIEQEANIDLILEYNDGFGKELMDELINSVIETNPEQDKEELFWLLTLGLAQEIKENDYNLDRMAVESIELSKGNAGSRKIFNFYDTDIDTRTYLGTFGLDSNFSEMIEFKSTNEKEMMEQIKQNYPQLQEAFISTSENGEIIAYMGEGQYILIDEFGQELSSEEDAIYSPSKLEKIQDKVLLRAERLKRLKKMNAPQPIISREEEMLREIIQEISELSEDKKITPSQIMEATEGISTQEIHQVIEEITNAKAKRDNIELGIRNKGEEIGD